MASDRQSVKTKKQLPRVTRGDISLPFSLVTLAHSLETIGIDLNLAHEISRNIGNEMMENGADSVARRDLRRRVYRRLAEKLGSETAERYMKFRNLTKLKKPLIIFVGGSTGSGKNTVSMELAHRLDISSVISTDVIRELMRSLFSEEILPMLHTSSYLAHEKLWIPLREGRSQETLAYREQSLRVNAGLKGLINRSIKEHTNLIINGVHILPDVLDPEDFENAYVVKVFLYLSDKDEHRKRFYIRGISGEQRPAGKYLENFDSIRLIQNYIVKRAREKGFLHINNRNSRDSAIRIISYITEKLASRGEIPHEEAQ